MSSGFIDLFCGAGGAACGFMQAGAEPVLGVDNDAGALNCWAQNAPGATARCAELFEGAELPPARPGLHLHCSTPCQTLSRQRRSTADEARVGLVAFRESLALPLRRGDHTWSSEQVPHARALALVRAFERRFPERVAHAVVDAADYGTPSSRTRLVVGPPALIQSLKERGRAGRVSMRAAFDAHRLSVPEGAVATTISRSRDGPQNRARRLDNVGFTVTASHPMTWVDEGGASLGCLSWRHGAALMGFPTEWSFPHTSRAAQRAVGNAIPPPLAKAIMEAAMESHARVAMPAPIEQAALEAVRVPSDDDGPAHGGGVQKDKSAHTAILTQLHKVEAELSALKRMLSTGAT